MPPSEKPARNAPDPGAAAALKQADPPPGPRKPLRRPPQPGIPEPGAEGRTARRAGGARPEGRRPFRREKNPRGARSGEREAGGWPR